ncbi:MULTISPECIES: hypothetical protein [Halorubrum]|uniref:Uncharacterized protein n=1 Tax=Halorubrum ruber TaxID=2982524 RepID=A0A8T8LQR6_9EURY|nr:MULTISPECIES: hypothetical protein [Halorubrum]QUO49104.1 hypothetical protein J7656_07165 [Halorubrum ruber]
MTGIVEFGTRADANVVRNDYADHLTGRFDRRFTKFNFADTATTRLFTTPADERV